MKKLISRTEYIDFIKTNTNSTCQFCDIKYQILLKEYKAFYWLVSISPYFKYHTILVPKRHFENYGEMNEIEMNELRNIYNDIKKDSRN